MDLVKYLENTRPPVVNPGVVSRHRLFVIPTAGYRPARYKSSRLALTGRISCLVQTHTRNRRQPTPRNRKIKLLVPFFFALPRKNSRATSFRRRARRIDPNTVPQPPADPIRPAAAAWPPVRSASAGRFRMADARLQLGPLCRRPSVGSQWITKTAPSRRDGATGELRRFETGGILVVVNMPV